MSIINVNEIRIGQILRYENKLYKVYDAQHVKPGKGGAYMQVEMKQIKVGTKVNVRLRTAETIERVSTETKSSNIMMIDNSSVTLMNPETYEQETYDIESYCGEMADFLEEGMDVKVYYIDGEVISINPQDTVVLEILNTQPYIKGATITSSFKPAYCRNEIKVMVPQYIENGEKILVKTETREFIERYKA